MSLSIKRWSSILSGVTACCAFFLGLVMVSACSTDDQTKPLKPLRVATGNCEPFVGEKLPHNGPIAEMISTILVDMGYAPKFKFYDWPMVEVHLKTGYPGLAFPYIKSEERVEDGFQFSDPLYTFEYVLFYRKDRAQEFSSIITLEEIKSRGLKIGRIRGYAKIPSITGDESYVQVSSAAEGFQMLRRSSDGNGSSGKKIDFLLESKAVGLRSLSSRDIAEDKDEFRYLGDNGNRELVSKTSLRIMLSSKAHNSILEKINGSINDNKNQELFDSLRERIGGGTQYAAFLSAENGKAIYGYTSPTERERGFLLPRNTKVLVVKWGVAYTKALDIKNEEQAGDKSRVKLLSGPLRGKVVWVDNDYLTLE